MIIIQWEREISARIISTKFSFTTKQRHGRRAEFARTCVPRERESSRRNLHMYRGIASALRIRPSRDLSRPCAIYSTVSSTRACTVFSPPTRYYTTHIRAVIAHVYAILAIYLVNARLTILIFDCKKTSQSSTLFLALSRWTRFPFCFNRARNYRGIYCALARPGWLSIFMVYPLELFYVSLATTTTTAVATLTGGIDSR